MTSAKEYDCVVIGAGVHGSFTAYELAKRNHKTLLLEQVQSDSWDFGPRCKFSVAWNVARLA